LEEYYARRQEIRLSVRLRQVALLAGAALSFAAHAQWNPQVEAAVVHDTNFSRAQREQDRIADTALTLAGAAERPLPVGPDIGFGVDARLAQYLHSEGASYAAAGVNGAWRGKLGLGLTAPRLVARASAALENARERVRDAARYAASLTAGRRFDDRLQASAGFAYDRRVQREDLAVVPGYGGKPFSLQGRSAFARADYAVTERLALVGSAAVRKGDVESSTRRNFTIFSASNAIANDPALGPDFIAYRITGARTVTLSGGLSWALGPNAALEASATRDDTAAGEGLDYVNRIYALTFVWRR
jgi:hypothetical protein